MAVIEPSSIPINKSACASLLLALVVCVSSPGQGFGQTQLIAPANSTARPIDSSHSATSLLPRSTAESPSRSESEAVVDVDRLVTELVLDNLPHSYTDDKKWGKQDERWDGLHIHRDGWKIETKRRKKLVNHGTWRKYSAQLLNPSKEFSVTVSEFRQLDNGNLGFDVDFSAHLALQGRESKWVKGVQLYSFSAEGTARVRLSVQVELDIDLEFNDVLPDVIFSPVVQQADLFVDEFELQRVSKLGGEFSQQVARATRSILDDKIVEKEQKIVEKINKQIHEKRDRLRLSLSDAIDSDWTEKAYPHLPASLQSIINAAK